MVGTGGAGYRIRISLKKIEKDNSYDIIFGNGFFDRIASDLKTLKLGYKHAIITDSNVGPLYAGSLEEALRREGVNVNTFTFEAGEHNKTIDTCMKVIGGMSKNGYGRDSAIIALGGGVVGDVAGFMAAIFNRGIPYVQIPTTVLAQADSSIGGKTAVDTEYGKNLVGRIEQPKRVYIDVATLQTLPDREYRSGLAEIVKHGIILDRNFFYDLQRYRRMITVKDAAIAIWIAWMNCGIKGDVVEKDPDEKGLRKILNYGHTAGHAVETLSVDRFESGKSTDYLLHGEAVSIGMMVAGRIAVALDYFAEAALNEQEEALRAFGLPVTIPDNIPDEKIIELLSRDKKAREGKAQFVLPVSMGQMHEFGGNYATPVDTKVVLEALQHTRQRVAK